MEKFSTQMLEQAKSNFETNLSPFDKLEQKIQSQKSPFELLESRLSANNETTERLDDTGENQSFENDEMLETSSEAFQNHDELDKKNEDDPLTSTDESEANEDAKVVSEKQEIEQLKKEYLDDLKANSDFPETIFDSDENYEKIPPEENAEKRKEFNNNKEKLIDDWEKNTGKQWPRYDEDVYLNGNLIRKKGDKYDAHHIQPLGLNGKNSAENITPVHALKHFDKQGVHAPDSPYAKINNILNKE